MLRGAGLLLFWAPLPGRQVALITYLKVKSILEDGSRKAEEQGEMLLGQSFGLGLASV